MSIDYSRNNYVKIGSYTNVVNEIPKLRMKQDGKSTISDKFDEFISKLSLRHPEWQFVGEDSWYYDDVKGFPVKRFRVYEGNDKLGSLALDTWRQEEKFEIRNERIASSMDKRSYKSTKDVGKAVKLVEKFFSAKTMSERLSEGKSNVQSAIVNKAWEINREFSKVMEKLTPALATYATLHMAEVRFALEAYGAPVDALDQLVDKNEDRKLMAAINAARNGNKGTTVLLHGDRYILISDADYNNSVTLTASQLTEDTRGKLGILKVVSDNEAVESVGMRINATMFYLLP